jgi:hypothetical protein
LNIGPYIRLDNSYQQYRASWRIKVSSKIPPDTPILLLKVFSHQGIYANNRRANKDYAALPLNSSDFPQKNVWQTKSVDFKYDGAEMMEFIAHAKILDPGSFLIDTVTIEALANP